MIKINLLKEKYKVCSRCGEVKLANDENWQKSCQTKDGWQGFCKECRNSHKKEYREKNREEINRKSREYYNQEDVKEKRATYAKQYYRDNIEWYSEWHKENNQKEETKKYKREWFKDKYNKDVKFKLHSCFSAQLRDCLGSKGIVKDRKCFEIVGYNLEELKCYLERQFNDRMNWKNYGNYWHIDHIKPKVSFDFNSYEDEEFKKCWSLENLRPLEKIENLRKGDREEKGE